MSAAEKVRVRFEEYLEMERAAVEKHELWNGEIYAMAGASPLHNRIAMNLFTSLGNGLRGRQCHAYPSDLKVQAGEQCFYPDATIVCGKDQLRDDNKDVLLNPMVIFEILSPSTVGFDYGGKFIAYRKIHSLQEYILIAQNEIRIDHFIKQQDGTWSLRAYRPGECVNIKAADLAIAVDDIYERVFEE